ncbi:MAG: hypothetical protein R2730_11710 [Chitinophagales bacterium]
MKTKKLPILLTLFLILLFPTGCSDDPTIEEDNPIAELKGDNWEENIGKEVTLEAYFVLSPEPGLFFNLEDRMKNTNIAEERYLRLDVDDELLRSIPDTYHGAKVKITGIIAKDQQPAAVSLAELFGSSYQAILEVDREPTLITPSDIQFEAINNICEASNICDIVSPFNPQTYILMFSGGISSSKAYSRYWNDLVFFHFIMTWVYGVDASKIKVVYKNGVGEDNFMPVHFAANPTGITAAFDFFEEEMDFDDTFIFFSTNHGGTNYNGTVNDDNNSFNNKDECMFYYNQSTPWIDDDIATRVNNLNFGRMLGIFEPCFAGGLIKDLQGENRILISASREDQVSWGGKMSYGNQYDDFVFYFTSALAGQEPNGTSVDADTNNDGKVSVAEAFTYARTNDTKDEIPQIDSDFNGNPSSTVAAESGNYASTFFIEP